MALTLEEQKLVDYAYKVSIQAAKEGRSSDDILMQINIIGTKSFSPMVIADPLTGDSNENRRRLHKTIMYGCSAVLQRHEKVLAVIMFCDTFLSHEHIENVDTMIRPSERKDKMDAIMTACATKDNTIIHYFPYVMRDNNLVWLPSQQVPKDQAFFPDLDINELYPKGL